MSFQQPGTLDWSSPNLRAKIASSTKAVTAITALKALHDLYTPAKLEDVLTRRVGAFLDQGMCGVSGATSLPLGSPVRDITLGQLLGFTSGLGDVSRYNPTSPNSPTSTGVGDSTYTTAACACDVAGRPQLVAGRPRFIVGRPPASLQVAPPGLGTLSVP